MTWRTRWLRSPSVRVTAALRGIELPPHVERRLLDDGGIYASNLADLLHDEDLAMRAAGLDPHATPEEPR